jgi:dipeptidyl aminopeptidase/acylaminoacyl peptidase
MRYACLLPMLLVSTAAIAEIPTPVRPVTDPKSLTSPADPLAAPVPVDDLVFSRGVADAAWSADGRQLFVSTNLTGRYNIWRMDSSGSWPVQLTQSDDGQSGFAVSPDSGACGANRTGCHRRRCAHGDHRPSLSDRR